MLKRFNLSFTREHAVNSHPSQAEVKINQIYEAVRDSIPWDVTCIRTKHAISIYCVFARFFAMMSGVPNICFKLNIHIGPFR